MCRAFSQGQTVTSSHDNEMTLLTKARNFSAISQSSPRLCRIARRLKVRPRLGGLAGWSDGGGRALRIA
jgi:hypothetical protein